MGTSAVIFHRVTYAGKAKKVRILCPACDHSLVKTKELITCVHCDFQAKEIREYVIPDEQLLPWARIVGWIDPEQGPKVTWNALTHMSQEELNDLREGVMRPLMEVWQQRNVKAGRNDEETAKLIVDVFLYGTGRDLAKELYNERQKKQQEVH